MLLHSHVTPRAWAVVTSVYTTASTYPHLYFQAFVVFGNPEEALRACLKDREMFCDGDKFGDRYIRVYPTVESDLPDIQECLALANSAQGQEVHHDMKWTIN